LVIFARVEAGMTPIPPLFLSHPQTRPRLPAGFFFIRAGIKSGIFGN
jgi:hypothetical protein